MEATTFAQQQLTEARNRKDMKAIKYWTLRIKRNAAWDGATK